MLAALGLFVFEMDSLPFSELTRRREWRHERTGRVGSRDASQFVGPGEDTITLSGVLVPGVAGRYAAIEMLVEMADTGDTFQLVDGTGRIAGGFQIVALDERRKHLMVDGVARLADFAVDLRRAA